jgi:hypothetical protein
MYRAGSLRAAAEEISKEKLESLVHAEVETAFEKFKRLKSPGSD